MEKYLPWELQPQVSPRGCTPGATPSPARESTALTIYERREADMSATVPFFSLQLLGVLPAPWPAYGSVDPPLQTDDE